MKKFIDYLDLYGVAFSRRARYKAGRFSVRRNYRLATVWNTVQRIRRNLFLLVFSLLSGVAIFFEMYSGNLDSDWWVLAICATLTGAFISLMKLCEAKILFCQ